MREYVLVLLVTAAVTYLLTPLVRRVAIVTRAVHAPRARDTHTKPTPLLGGLAMYGGLVAGLVVASRLNFLQDPFQVAGSKTAAGLLLAGALVVVIGFIDDRWGLGAISKLAGQVAAAGILVWSGQSLPWLPMPSGGVFSLEPDLSLTLTILLVVVTMNAINFIDGLDGLAAGITAVAAVSFLVYSYRLIQTIGNTSQSLPAVSSALLAGMCLGFLPHNFYPARIFMGDIGSMLLGLMLAYGPISSTASLDPALLTNYSSHAQTLDRFPTFLPLLVPAAIFVIPYADLMFAVIRRAKAGKPLMAADRQHLHHRVLNIGHSYRQSVLIMYLWAALFSAAVVSLSVVRTRLVVFEVATAVAVLTLLPVTMPSLRPWRLLARHRSPPTPAPGASTPASTPAPASTPGAPTPASAHGASAPRSRAAALAAARTRATPRNRAARNRATTAPVPATPPAFAPAPVPAAPLAPTPAAATAPAPGTVSAPGRVPTPATPVPPTAPGTSSNGLTAYPSPYPAAPYPDAPYPASPYPDAPYPGDQLPRAGRLPGADPAALFTPTDPSDPGSQAHAYPGDPYADRTYPGPGYSSPDHPGTNYTGHGYPTDGQPGNGYTSQPGPDAGHVSPGYPGNGYTSGGQPGNGYASHDYYPSQGYSGLRPDPYPGQDPLWEDESSSGETSLPGPAAAIGPVDNPDPGSVPQHPDVYPW